MRVMDRRQKILFDLDKTYNEIYGFTEDMGDDALELLNMYIYESSLTKDDAIMLHALLANEDPTNLSDDVLSALLAIYEDALGTLREMTG
tara:strand:- start:314 stop:583 length:270 start_codon:yes stop_codon:yes gene_type:complete